MLRTGRREIRPEYALKVTTVVSPFLFFLHGNKTHALLSVLRLAKLHQRRFLSPLQRLHRVYEHRPVAVPNKPKSNNKMKVKIKKLHPDAVIPKKAHATDAGFDLTAVNDTVIPARGRALLNTGIAIDIPIGYAGFVVGRSGNTIRRGLVGQLGIVDTGYQDAIGVMAFNETDEDISVAKGERIGQIVIVPHLPADFDESADFKAQNRNGGFGSTGK